MPKKETNNNKDEVIDLRSRIEIKPKTAPAPIKINDDFEKVPQVKAGIGKIMLIILILLAGISLIAGWLFLSKPHKENNTSLKMVVDAPKTVSAGVPFTIKIDYENIDIAVLKKMQLTVDHSPLWHLQSAEVMPEDANQSFWKLDDLAVNGKNELNLTGVIYGEKDQENDFKIKFNYQPENFSSQFEDIVSFKIVLNKSYFVQKSDLPTEINLDDNKVFDLVYVFDGEQEATSTDFELTLPEGVKIASSTPVVSGNVWRFDSWKSGEEKTISLIFTSNRATTGQIKMTARKDGVEIGVWQSEVKILAPNLSLSLERIGSGNINYGDNVALQLNINNNSDGDINIDNISVIADNDLINWSKVNVKGANVANKQIIWMSEKGNTGKQIKSVPAGAQLQIDFSLPIVEKKDVSLVQINNLAIKLSLVGQVLNNKDTKDVNGSGLELKIASPFFTSAVGRYYASADSPVGSGPLPPQVGKKTSYQIVWTVFAGEDSLKDLSFTSSLPDYVSWEGQDEEVSGGGQVKCDDASKKISWDVKQLAAQQQLSVAFMVSVTPVDSQLNQIMVLTNAASFTSKKETNGSTVSNAMSLITSELPDDEIASGKGRVKAQ